MIFVLSVRCLLNDIVMNYKHKAYNIEMGFITPTSSVLEDDDTKIDPHRYYPRVFYLHREYDEIYPQFICELREGKIELDKHLIIFHEDKETHSSHILYRELGLDKFGCSNDTVVLNYRQDDPKENKIIENFLSWVGDHFLDEYILTLRTMIREERKNGSW